MEIVRVSVGQFTDAQFAEGYLHMSPARREKCARLRREIDRKCCIAADMAVRNALSARFGVSPAAIDIRVTPEGKPYAPDFPVRFSYAHCEGEIVLALGEREVGADIERVRPVSPRITRYFCCDSDLVYVFGAPAAPEADPIEDPEVLSRLFEVWTFKEALGKAWGTGLTKETKYAPFADYPKYLAREEDFALCAYECEENA